MRGVVHQRRSSRALSSGNDRPSAAVVTLCGPAEGGQPQASGVREHSGQGLKWGGALNDQRPAGERARPHGPSDDLLGDGVVPPPQCARVERPKRCVSALGPTAMNERSNGWDTGNVV